MNTKIKMIKDAGVLFMNIVSGVWHVGWYEILSRRKYIIAPLPSWYYSPPPPTCCLDILCAVVGQQYIAKK